jgi:hypothetical protein
MLIESCAATLVSSTLVGKNDVWGRARLDSDVQLRFKGRLTGCRSAVVQGGKFGQSYILYCTVLYYSQFPQRFKKCSLQRNLKKVRSLTHAYTSERLYHTMIQSQARNSIPLYLPI